MQDYQRTIFYLCVYEDGRKGKCVGFVKLEERDGQCRIRICLNRANVQREAGGSASLFFHYRNRLIGIPLGELRWENGSMEWQTVLKEEELRKRGITFSQIRGVRLQGASGREYVAEQGDRPVDVTRFFWYPSGGKKCLGCPRLEHCGRNRQDGENDGRNLYERSDPTGP